MSRNLSGLTDNTGGRGGSACTSHNGQLSFGRIQCVRGSSINHQAALLAGQGICLCLGTRRACEPGAGAREGGWPGERLRGRERPAGAGAAGRQRRQLGVSSGLGIAFGAAALTAILVQHPFQVIAISPAGQVVRNIPQVYTSEGFGQVYLIVCVGGGLSRSLWRWC